MNSQNKSDKKNAPSGKVKSANISSFSNLANHLPDALIITDMQANVVVWNAAAEQLYGWKSREVLGKTLQECIRPGDQDCYINDVLAGMGEAETWSGMVIQMRRDGERIPVWTSLSITREPDGAPSGIIYIDRDVTEFKQAGMNMPLNEHEFSAALQAGPHALIISRQSDGVILELNKNWEDITGFSRNESLGRSSLDLGLFPDMEQRKRLFEQESLHNFEMEIRQKPGNLHWVSLSAKRIILGQQECVLTFLSDINERKQAELALRENETRWRALIENSADAIAMLSEDGTILYESPSVFRLSGYSPEALTGLNAFQTLHPDDQARVAEAWGPLLQQAGASVTVQFRIRHKNRAWLWIEAIATNLLNDPSVHAVILNYRDITERKRTEIEQQVSLEIMQGLAVSNDLDEFLGLVHLSLGRVIKADNFFVALYDPSSGMFEEMYAVDQYDKPMPPSRREKTLTSYIFHTREPFLSTKQLFEELLASGEVELVGVDSLSFLGVPLIIYGQAIGVMVVQDYENADIYSERDLHFMMSLAGQVALSVQRKQAEKTLQLTSLRLNALINHLDSGVLYEDKERHVTYVNRRFCDLFGIPSPEVLLGADCRALAQQAKAAFVESETFIHKIEQIIAAQQTVMGQEMHLVDGRILRRDYVPMVVDGSYQGHLWQYRDITKRKQVEEALRESEQRLELFIEHAPAALAMFDQEMRYLAVSRRWMMDYHLEDKDVIGQCHYDVFPELTDHWKEAHRRGLSGEVVQADEDKFTRADGSVQWQRWEVRPWYLVDGAAGGIVIFTEDITERVLAKETLNRRVGELTALYQTTLDIINIHDLSKLLSTIVARAVGLLNGKSGGLYLCNQEQRQALCVVSYNTPEDYTGTALAYGEGAAGTVAATGKPLILNDYRTWGGRAGTYEEKQPFRAMISVPMLWQGQVTGVIHVLDDTEQHKFTDEDLKLLTPFANQAAVAVENARLLDETQRRLKRLSTMRQIEQVITNSLDLRVTLNILLRHVLQQLEVDAATILLYQPELQNLEFIAGLGFRTRALQSTKLRLGQGFAGQAALEQRIVQISDLRQKHTGFLRSPEFFNEGFVTYVGVPLINKGKITGVLEIYHRRPLSTDPEWMEFLEALAGQAAIAIDNIRLFEDLQTSNFQLLEAYDATIKGWADALQLRDMKVEGHNQRAVDMTLDLARKMGIQENQLTNIRWGALLHDIGKMGVPDAILQKPGPLTDEEWVAMRQHPVYAYKWLSPISYLKPSLDIPYCHHEKWDGTGYPRGLQGEQIPVAARIFAVVDVWDALTSDRPYRRAWTKEKAIKYIRDQSGHAFDPKVVNAFLQRIATDETTAT